VAVATYLIGCAPNETIAKGDNFLSPGIADDAHLHCSYPGGVTSHLHVSWLWPELRRQTVVIGSTATMVYDESSQTIQLHQKFINQDLEKVDNGSQLLFEGSAQPLTLEMEHFIQCITDRSTPRSGPQNAIDVVAVLEKASESMHV
jgi:predicted dehydrogenase